MAKGMWWDVTYLLKDKAKEKFGALKNPQYSALLLVEFFLTLILAGAIILYLDGKFNQIEQPFNLLIFAAIAYGVLHFYNYTYNFRAQRRDEIKRISNLKTHILGFVIVLVIVISAAIYQDTTINILPEPYNLVAFFVVLIVPLYFYISEKFIKAQVFRAS